MSAAKKQRAEHVVDVEVGDDVVELQPVTEQPAKPEPELVTIEFRGHTFTIPKLLDRWKTEACLALNQGEGMRAAKILLGPMQWAELQSLGDEREDTFAFLDVFGAVIDRECVA